jgi:hypothetical protein
MMLCLLSHAGLLQDVQTSQVALMQHNACSADIRPACWYAYIMP